MHADAFIADMRRRGVGTLNAAPPIIRLAWALGWPISPPIYWDSLLVFLFNGITMGGVVAAAAYATDRFIRHEVMPASFYGYCLAASILIAGSIACWFLARERRRAAPLPPWSSYL